MVLSACMVCFGQLFWKLSVDGNLLCLLAGFMLYGLGAIVMIVAYKFGSLSVLQPVLSVNYVLCLVIGHYFLNETITLANMVGVVAIIAGVVLIAGGD